MATRMKAADRPTSEDTLVTAAIGSGSHGRRTGWRTSSETCLGQPHDVIGVIPVARDIHLIRVVLRKQSYRSPDACLHAAFPGTRCHAHVRGVGTPGAAGFDHKPTRRHP